VVDDLVQRFTMVRPRLLRGYVLLLLCVCARVH
jgi:hypothetical protein